MAQGMLALIDPDALAGLDVSNAGVRHYDIALNALAGLDDRKQQTANTLSGFALGKCRKHIC